MQRKQDGDRREMTRTLEKRLSRRGVIWLGQTCNQHCRFCYFIDRVADQSHPEHHFMSLEKAKQICRTLVEYYGNNAVDLQGGEPTLYVDIFKLVSFCRRIGLSPTLITNGLLLDSLEICRRYRDAGLHDFLLSVHGMGDVHDQLVGCPGAHRRQLKAIENLLSLDIPFRFNVVMTKPALLQLPAIADLAIAAGVRVVNFIAFNPFADQGGGRRCYDDVPRYGEVSPYLNEALDRLDQGAVEGNVRYFPFCMVAERHRKSVYNFQQLPYDPYEWDFASWGWTGLKPQRTAMGEPSPPVALHAGRRLLRHKETWKRLAENRFLKPVFYQGHRFLSGLCSFGNLSPKELYREVARIHAEMHCGYAYGEACATCAARKICDGFHGDYATIFGCAEACAVQAGAAAIDDPLFYLNSQMKSLLVPSISCSVT